MKANKKLALIATTLVLSSSAQANFLKDLLDKFGSVNKEAKSECASMTDKEVADLCVQEVCGDASKNPIIFDAQQASQRYHTPEMQAKIDEQEQILRNYEKFMNDEVKKLEDYRQELLNLTPEKITDEDAKEILESIVKDIKEEYKILNALTSDVSKKDTIKITLPPGSRFKDIYKDVIAKINIYDHLSFSNNIYQEKRSYDKEFQAYQQKAKLLQEGLKNTGKSTDFDFKAHEEKLLRAGKPYASGFYLELLKEAKKAGIELEAPLCDLACKKSLVTFLQNKAKFTKYPELAANGQAKFDFDDAVAECKATMTLASIKAKDTSVMEQEFPKLVEKLKNNTSLKFSDHSKGLLLEKINKDLKLKFNYNPYEEMNMGLDPHMKNFESVPYDNMGIKYKELTDKKFAEKLVNTPRCKPLRRIATVSDMVMFDPKKNEGTLHVSPFSCEHTHIGTDIMAHELGHAVSFFIAYTPDMSKETREGFKALRECSRAEKRSTKFPGLLSPHEGDKWTTEEDTADLFSFALSDNKEHFMGCALVIPTGEEYVGLKMRKSFIDTHSSGIQRLMVELQYKNPEKITEACEEVIKRSKAKITNKCF